MSKDISFKSVDALVASTLKKHGAKLDKDKLEPKDKETILDVVKNMQKSVDEITKKTTDKEK
ncbi:hypothetical protein [Aquibacillus kalidii]|uniref:hypothetical protein n=1 Tax=Aquibacillus kalidii TaxID=2762597 RepID=UPI001647A353|nr:hypothetical protein [Aquibacillus kalidii]